ncbi:DnaT-like ssDNA-binding domain-containing protein [Pseudomonas sp. BF-R-12]|uniref:DnaT-like ssDNA-binding domain-containing protein n=1 Tax=Pseudomonas sp. BF-R-12 TaxID=2832363 RepID=UPI001CBF7867|nr:DnaT-like ssDNA-binding domain-containing protein [Pseudomonas sp. BF-R-12]
MARIRTIKPEFWSSEQVMESRPLARLLFIGLWNFCDDGGNHPLSPRTIKALVFPGDDITTEAVSELLGELEGSGLTRSYTVDGKQYLHVSGWKHQKIEKKNFKYPPVPEPVVEQSSNGSGSVVEESSTGRPPVDPVMDVDVDVEGNGEDQHHSHTAGEEPQPELDLDAAPEPVDPKAPVEMALEWMPDENLLKTYCVHFGVSTDLFTREAIAPFTAHHETTGILQVQSKWVSLLVKWVKDDKHRASNVRQFPKRESQSRHTGFAERDYTAGLITREDGSYAI